MSRFSKPMGPWCGFCFREISCTWHTHLQGLSVNKADPLDIRPQARHETIVCGSAAHLQGRTENKNKKGQSLNILKQNLSHINTRERNLLGLFGMIWILETGMI
jgi:hypothetical protein